VSSSALRCRCGSPCPRDRSLCRGARSSPSRASRLRVDSPFLRRSPAGACAAPAFVKRAVQRPRRKRSGLWPRRLAEVNAWRGAQIIISHGGGMVTQFAERVEKTAPVRYRVVALATCLAAITHLDRACIATLAPGIMRDLGLTTVQMGYVFTAFQLAYALF